MIPRKIYIPIIHVPVFCIKYGCFFQDFRIIEILYPFNLKVQLNYIEKKKGMLSILIPLGLCTFYGSLCEKIFAKVQPLSTKSFFFFSN